MTQITQEKTRILNPICNTRNRVWVFTLNNYTENDIKYLLTQFTHAFLYAFQEELGNLGTPHLQGIVKWKNAKSFKSMRKLLSKAHWEPCKNLKASILYCLKEKTRNGRSWKKNTEKYIAKTVQTKALEFDEWLILFRNTMIHNSWKNPSYKVL